MLHKNELKANFLQLLNSHAAAGEEAFRSAQDGFNWQGRMAFPSLNIACTSNW